MFALKMTLLGMPCNCLRRSTNWKDGSKSKSIRWLKFLQRKKSWLLMSCRRGLLRAMIWYIISIKIIMRIRIYSSLDFKIKNSPFRKLFLMQRISIKFKTLFLNLCKLSCYILEIMKIHQIKNSPFRKLSLMRRLSKKFKTLFLNLSKLSYFIPDMVMKFHLKSSMRCVTSRAVQSVLLTRQIMTFLASIRISLGNLMDNIK